MSAMSWPVRSTNRLNEQLSGPHNPALRTLRQGSGASGAADFTPFERIGGT